MHNVRMMISGRLGLSCGLMCVKEVDFFFRFAIAASIAQRVDDKEDAEESKCSAYRQQNGSALTWHTECIGGYYAHRAIARVETVCKSTISLVSL